MMMMAGNNRTRSVQELASEIRFNDAMMCNPVTEFPPSDTFMCFSCRRIIPKSKLSGRFPRRCIYCTGGD